MSQIECKNVSAETLRLRHAALTQLQGIDRDHGDGDGVATLVEIDRYLAARSVAQGIPRIRAVQLRQAIVDAGACGVTLQPPPAAPRVGSTPAPRLLDDPRKAFTAVMDATRKLDVDLYARNVHPDVLADMTEPHDPASPEGRAAIEAVITSLRQWFDRDGWPTIVGETSDAPAGCRAFDLMVGDSRWGWLFSRHEDRWVVGIPRDAA